MRKQILIFIGNIMCCRYVPEANMTACGTDYLTMAWQSRSYIVVYASFAYLLPLLVIIYAYYFIVKASLKSIKERNINIKLDFEIGSSITREDNERTSKKNECVFVEIWRSKQH